MARFAKLLPEYKSAPQITRERLYIETMEKKKKVLGTGEKPAYHFTPDVTAGFKPEASLLQQQSQAELDAQAKALLQAAGYGPNNPLKLTLLYNTSESHQKIAIAVASMWKKKLGIDVKLQNQEWKLTSTAAIPAISM
ncbi:hypothetical protein AK51_19045 [Serratia nematodiphila DZ0503SBS1]|nr:hypothetical protein AK51_19045 [Serratia nematodiphila DZ0503SBS1]